MIKYRPSYPEAAIALVGISNTLDLMDRLSARVRSRFGFARVSFAPYTPEQLQIIIEARLKEAILSNAKIEVDERVTLVERSKKRKNANDSGVVNPLFGRLFEEDAIKMAARKVASMSGDARRALQICGRAVEICERSIEVRDEEQNKKPKKASETKKVDATNKNDPTHVVQLEHVLQAVKELFVSSTTDYIKYNTSIHEKYFFNLKFLVIIRLFLVSAVKTAQTLGSSEFLPLLMLYERYIPICNSVFIPTFVPNSTKSTGSYRFPPVNYAQFSEIATSLSTISLVQMTWTGPDGRGRGSQLGVGDKEIRRQLSCRGFFIFIRIFLSAIGGGVAFSNAGKDIPGEGEESNDLVVTTDQQESRGVTSLLVHPMVHLRVMVDDVTFALEDDDLCGKLFH